MPPSHILTPWIPLEVEKGKQFKVPSKSFFVVRYPEKFTSMPCEWNCFYYDWQEREGDHQAGRHPQTCPNPQCGKHHSLFVWQ